jgi:hypothetical protein
MSLSRFAGQYNAVDYAYGINPQVSSILVTNGPAATGSGALTTAFGYFTAADGSTVLAPFNTNAPISVGTKAFETVTPSAVSNSTPQIYNTCQVTATFSNLHGNGDSIGSGTVGLQEAINYANTRGGGTVIVDATWTKLGGTSAMLNAATLPSNGTVQILDNRGGQGSAQQTLTLTVPNASVLTLNTVGYPLIPAPGAGNLIEVDRLWLEQIAATAAFASGGNITAAYGTQASQTAATAVIAATVLTGGSGTTNQIGSALPVSPANGNSSVLLNKAVGLYAATGDFTTGGGTLLVKISYRILTGF